jgi:hypothetical protein
MIVQRVEGNSPSRAVASPNIAGILRFYHFAGKIDKKRTLSALT